MSVCTVCIVITDARLVHTDWARELWDKLFPLRQKREKKKETMYTHSLETRSQMVKNRKSGR